MENNRELQISLDIPETIGDFLERGGVKNPSVFNGDMDILMAIRKMSTNRYSQVPVCSYEGKLQGFLSWESVFRGVCKSEATLCGVVADYYCTSLDDKIISLDAPIRDALARIRTSEFLIIVDSIYDLNVMGLITVSDLSALYSVILQGFTLIGEIESHLRTIITSADIEIIELQKLTQKKNIERVKDLTMGNFSYVMNNERIWPRLSISKSLDMADFHKQTSQVTYIRNRIMHNNWLCSDEVDVYEDIRILENFLSLLSDHM